MDEQMREKFEKWATTQIEFGLNGNCPDYTRGATRDAWKTWQACAAALSQPAAQGDSSHSAGGECGGVPQWRPIETAPKDFGTTPFDVWTGFERLADCWWGVPTYPENVRKESGIVRLDSYDSNGPVVERVKNATLWIPLPAAPKATP